MRNNNTNIIQLNKVEELKIKSAIMKEIKSQINIGLPLEEIEFMLLGDVNFCDYPETIQSSIAAIKQINEQKIKNNRDKTKKTEAERAKEEQELKLKQAEETKKATKKIYTYVNDAIETSIFMSKEEITELIIVEFTSLENKKDVIGCIIDKAIQDKNNKQKHLDKYKLPWYKINARGNIELIYDTLAQHIVKKYNILMVVPYLYFYSNGVYKQLTDNELKTIIRMELETDFRTPFYITQIFIMITDMSANICCKFDDFDKNNNIINFKNGLYSISENKMYKHTPNYKSMLQLNCNYNANAICPTWDYFIKDALFEDKDTIQLLEEVLGYMLVKDISAQKMFVLHGKSNTGKSVVLSIYKEIIGTDMFTSMSLQELSRDDSKSTHQLQGKLANVCGDLPQESLKDTGKIKQLTGEDAVTVDIKYKEAVTFLNYARLLFSCNQIPKSYKDKSDAFYNRLIILPFNNVKEESQQDKQLKGKLYAEIEGIVLKFIQGLIRYRQNGFTVSKAVEKELKEYKTSNNTVLSFIEDCYIILDKKTYQNNINCHKLQISSLYQEYKNYCIYMGFKNLCNQKSFKEQIINNNDIVYKEREATSRNLVMNLKITDNYELVNIIRATY